MDYLDRSMNFMYSGYSNNHEGEFLFNSPCSNGPVNNYNLIEMCCGAGQLLTPDPFGLIRSSLQDRFDPVDLLPPDPFGMGIHMESSFNQQTSLLSGFDNWNHVVGDSLLEGFSYILKNQSFVTPSHQSANLDAPLGETKEFANPKEGNNIHEAMYYALGYLGVKDLLNVKRVCKSLYQTIETDPLLWREIQIDSTLSEKITDSSLLEITQKAQGNLKSLILISCTRITDEGLSRVLELNPKLTKLYVPECARLNLDNIIKTLKTVKSSGNPGIKHLKLGRLFSVSESQYKELTELLDTNSPHEKPQQQPRFYNVARFSLVCDEDRALDLEMCPVCGKYRLVYDCPMETCGGAKEGACSRACESCVLRCVQCGRCIRDNTYVETFSFEYLCTVCWNHPAVW